MTFRNCVAVDLGASSGRVMLARYERECRSLTLREIHRFNNGLHSQNGYVTWNVDSLEGLRDLNVKEEDFAVLATNALKDACGFTNPIQATHEEIVAIYRAAM